MFTSLRGIFFGATTIDGYSGAESDGLANTLRTTATDDEWLLVDHGAIPSKEHTEPSKCSGQIAAQSGSQPSPSSASDRVGDDSSSESTDGWCIMPPPIFDVDCPAQPVNSDPIENLLIEHASMSVYGSLRPRTAYRRSNPPKTTDKPTLAAAERKSSAAPCNDCVIKSECYNLRKRSMQKALSSKKQATRRAFQRGNQTSLYPKHVRHNMSRPVVFQPRK